MANCEPFREQLLNFVYGICDESEVQELRAHLEVCQSCHDALEWAEAQRLLIGRAALAVTADEVPEFHHPAKAVPALHEEPAAEEPPAVLPMPLVAAPIAATAAPVRRAPRYRRWFAVAAAAAVLLVAGTFWHLYESGRVPLANAIAAHKESLKDIDVLIAALPKEFKAEAELRDRKLRLEAPLHVHMLSPAQLQQASGEVVQVAVRDIDGQPVASKVTLTVEDADGKQVLAQYEMVALAGMATLSLADDLATALTHRTAVQMVARAERGQAAAQAQAELRVAAPGYATHLTTNKTVYRPGELLFFRALVLDRASLTPPATPVALRFSLVDAAGHPVGVADALAGPGGIAAGELPVTDKLADGNYELRVAAEQPAAVQVRPHTRKLQIARDVNFDLLADRDKYRGGDIVNLTVPRGVAQTQAPTMGKGKNDMLSNFDVYLDGKPVPLLQAMPGYSFGQAGAAPHQGFMAKGGGPSGGIGGGGIGGGFAGGAGGIGNGGMFQNDPKSQINLSFALPKNLDASRARVTVKLKTGKDGKVRETFEQDLAVMPSKVAVDFFPESGELIAGVPNRVYYRVRSPRGEPVSPDGRVIVLSGSDVLFDSPPGEGTGSFTFTPKAGDTYVARISSADDAITEFADPFGPAGGVRADGLVLHAPAPVSNEDEAFDVVLRNSASPRRVLLVAQCRGRLVAQQWVEAKGEDTVSLGSLPGTRGIVRLTAYEADTGALKPLAERLVYRTPAQRLDLSALHLMGGIIGGRQGKGVYLELRARDQNGAPTPAWVLAAVIDERFRTREPSPIAHFLIAGDVSGGDDLDNALLLAADVPETRRSLELFLGTMGWRRFETGPGNIAPAALLAAAGLVGVENASFKALQKQHESKVEEALTPLRLELQPRIDALSAARSSAQTALDRARADLAQYEAEPALYLRVGLGAVTLLLLAMAVGMVGIGAWRLIRRRQATLVFAGTFACLGLCFVSLLVLSAMGPPVEVGTAVVAGRKGALSQLEVLNFALFFRSAENKAPVGQIALANANRLDEKEGAAIGLGARQAGQAGDLAELPDAKSVAEGNALRLAQKDNQASSSTAPALDPALLHRFNAAVADNKKALDNLAKAAPAPVAGGGPPGPGGAFNAELEQQLRSEQSRRIYTFNRVPGLEPDTLFWNPALFLSNGSYQVGFDVPASPGAYRVLLLGHTSDGRLGIYEGRLEVQPELAR